MLSVSYMDLPTCRMIKGLGFRVYGLGFRV
jgi:hypothetical protein